VKEAADNLNQILQSSEWRSRFLSDPSEVQSSFAERQAELRKELGDFNKEAEENCDIPEERMQVLRNMHKAASGSASSASGSKPGRSRA
jgi:hypothetical protein